mgnify:CR=1 FL=1
MVDWMDFWIIYVLCLIKVTFPHTPMLSKTSKCDEITGSGGNLLSIFYQLLSIFYVMTFSPHPRGTRWKNWSHFGLKIGFICPGCMAKVLAIAFVGLCLTFSPYSRASFSVFSTCCLVYLATSRSDFDFRL